MGKVALPFVGMMMAECAQSQPSFCCLNGGARPYIWKLNHNMELILLVSAITYYVVGNIWWGYSSQYPNLVHTQEGSILCAIWHWFKPFGIAYVTTFGVSFFPNSLQFVSVIGITIIRMGYCTVMWGQIKADEDKTPCDASSDPLDKKVLLLQEKVEE